MPSSEPPAGAPPSHGEPVRIALTIAGSDSGGGAGIQADLKTFHQFGVFGTSVVTAVTAQNTLGVRSWVPLPPVLVTQQIDALADDLPPLAVKTGMLGSANVVTAVADALGRHGLANYVLDPVMVATSGDRLLDSNAERWIVKRLIPLATIMTPNLDEAAVLVGNDVRTPDQMAARGARVARARRARGPHYRWTPAGRRARGRHGDGGGRHPLLPPRSRGHHVHTWHRMHPVGRDHGRARPGTTARASGRGRGGFRATRDCRCAGTRGRPRPPESFRTCPAPATDRRVVNHCRGCDL